MAAPINPALGPPKRMAVLQLGTSVTIDRAPARQGSRIAAINGEYIHKDGLGPAKEHIVWCCVLESEAIGEQILSQVQGQLTGGMQHLWWPFVGITGKRDGFGDGDQESGQAGSGGPAADEGVRPTCRLAGLDIYP